MVVYEVEALSTDAALEAMAAMEAGEAVEARVARPATMQVEDEARDKESFLILGRGPRRPVNPE